MHIPSVNKTDFEHVEHWIFDLDNTLYPRECDLFAQIDIKMTEYVMELLSLPFDEARIIQKELYRDHGTTLNGLIKKHGINPQDYLDKVHDIDYSHMPANPELGALIDALPGRKFIFTNGDKPHTERTLAQLQIADCFEGVYDIIDARLVPKPAAGPYEQFIEKFDISPKSAAMFEDMPRNLFVPKNMGMKTVLIEPEDMSKWNAESWEKTDGANIFIDYQTKNLNDFLKILVG